MTDVEIVTPTIQRDADLERRMLEAVIADRNAHPRNQQHQVGPSSIGFCRELLRHALFEEGFTAAEQQETHWATAAHVGTVMGADLERIFGERLGALEQQRITTVLGDLGLKISGAMDLVFIDDLHITDLKSTTDIGGILYDLNKNARVIESLLAIFQDGELYNRWIDTPDGQYELTQSLLNGFSKLHYYVQIAVYVTGARQAGILPSMGEGRLVFYDRAGDYQEFVALIVDAKTIDLFFAIGMARIAQVVEAQKLLDEHGNPALIHYLRDQTPAFCFSKKVMCPLRLRCWGGSEWSPVEVLEGAEITAAVDRYIEGRRLAALGDGMKKAAREELRGIEGRLPNGRMVSWVRGGSTINVVETTTEAKEESDG